jgi:anaerobic magnesium-protoporphyrin IX monomethyl ester cyclase
MKIVLIRPPEINRVWAGIPEFFNTGVFLFPPLGILQLKAYIEKYTPWEAIIYDSLLYRADYDRVASFVNSNEAEVAGICTFTHSLKDVVETAKALKLKNPEVHVVAGGPHTYTFPEESEYLLETGYIDSVVLGDGEEALKNILEAIRKNSGFENIDSVIYKDKDGNIKKNGAPGFIKDLDLLPFPSRNTFKFRQYYTPASCGSLMTTIISSRGCPYNCKFCNVQKQYRSRSINNIADEAELCSKSGFKEIFFVDDTFNATKERVIKFSEELLKRKLRIRWGFKARCDNVNREMLDIAKKAGCFRIHYGVETGLPQGLSSIDKRETLDTIKSAFSKTKESGIRTTAYFMIGCPHETNISDIKKTIDFSVSLKADFAVFSLLSPYPDTGFYKEGVSNGTIDPKPWCEFIKNPVFRQELPTCWEESFTKTELISLLKMAHRKFYYRPGIIFNALFSVHSPNEFIRLIGGGVSLFKFELADNEEKL